MRFVYYIAAIGNGGLDRKLEILSKNLNYLYNNLKEKFDIVVNCYNSYNEIETFLQRFDFLNLKLFHQKAGILTELFLTNPHNASLGNYDYILFMLDDVEIQHMDLRGMIHVKEKFKIEVFSPKVISSTHPFMNTYDSAFLTINNAIEVYCLLLRYKDFVKFLSMHTIENKWMWGADFLFGHLNIKAGVCYKYTVVHKMLPSKQKLHKNANALADAYLKNKKFFGSIKNINPYIQIINLKTGEKQTVSTTKDDASIGVGMNFSIGQSGSKTMINKSDLKDKHYVQPSYAPAVSTLPITENSLVKTMGQIKSNPAPAPASAPSRAQTQVRAPSQARAQTQVRVQTQVRASARARPPVSALALVSHKPAPHKPVPHKPAPHKPVPRTLSNTLTNNINNLNKMTDFKTKGATPLPPKAKINKFTISNLMG